MFLSARIIRREIVSPLPPAGGCSNASARALRFSAKTFLAPLSPRDGEDGEGCDRARARWGEGAESAKLSSHTRARASPPRRRARPASCPPPTTYGRHNRLRHPSLTPAAAPPLPPHPMAADAYTYIYLLSPKPAPLRGVPLSRRRPHARPAAGRTLNARALPRINTRAPTRSTPRRRGAAGTAIRLGPRARVAPGDDGGGGGGALSNKHRGAA